jgi:hypothetical protein
VELTHSNGLVDVGDGVWPQANNSYDVDVREAGASDWTAALSGAIQAATTGATGPTAGEISSNGMGNFSITATNHTGVRWRWLGAMGVPGSWFGSTTSIASQSPREVDSVLEFQAYATAAGKVTVSNLTQMIVVASGTSLGTTCDGFNKHANVADGWGGGFLGDLIEENSTDCGWSPDSPPGDP